MTVREAAVITMWTDLMIMLLLALDVYMDMQRGSN